MTVLSIDIGGTNFRLGAVRDDGTVAKFDKVSAEAVFQSGNVLEDLSQIIRDFSSDLSFDAVSVGFPATLNRERTRVVQAPNIPFMEEITEGVICGIYFGTGIGNAILVGGTPFTGRHGTAGELGHIPVPGCSIPCGCGNIGCLEAYAGGKALARIRRDRYPETPIEEIFSCHGEEKELLEVIDGMAVAVSTEINILDPDQVLLGGGVLSMKDFPRARLEQKIREHTRKPLPWQELELIYTGDEPDKSVIGGAVYARRKLGF